MAVRNNMTTATDRALLHELLADVGDITVHEPADVLFREDDPALGVYVIHSGEVDLIASLPGRMPRAIRRAGPGEILSVSQVVAGRPHDATAIAATTARIDFVTRDDFLAALDANPGAWPSVLQLLSQQIHSMYDAMKAPV